MSEYYFLKQKGVNKPKGVEVVFNNIYDISKFIIENNYSSGQYKANKRSVSNWNKSNIVILDIDDVQPNGKTISDVSVQFKNYNHIIAPTKSHQIVKGDSNLKIDRYRILLFVSDYIHSPEIYKETCSFICKNFNLNADTICMEPSHLFFPSKFIHSITTDGLNFDIPLHLIDSMESIADNKKKKPEFSYRLSKEDIPEKLLAWVNSVISSKTRNKRERFLRILMAQRNLVFRNKNGDFIGNGKCLIHQVGVAKELSIEPKTIRKWINDLIKLGQLECRHPDYYGKGWKCRDYRAMNELEAVILNAFHNVENVVNSPNLPSYIEDGTWEKVLIKAVWKFAKQDNPENFYAWVRSIPTFNEKPERENKMKRAWINMQKKIKNR